MNPDVIAGRYRVLRPIGKGGMGTVWLCRDEVLGREVAVKQIGVLPGEDATDAARALREARSSAALSHRSVVSVFDAVDTRDGRAWLVMEYVPSRTLSEIAREEGPLDPLRAAAIGAQVAEGLEAAHATGTVHRDVKPGNILVGEGDQAKISDFGIARRDNDDQITRTGLVTGTPAYFSPELARGDDPSPASDVYALGAALYTAVEGRGPYPEQRNPIALLQKIASEEPRPAERAGPLAPVIARMMDRDPRTRWTMADATHALRRVAQRGGAQHGGAQRGGAAQRLGGRGVPAVGGATVVSAAATASGADGGSGVAALVESGAGAPRSGSGSGSGLDRDQGERGETRLRRTLPAGTSDSRRRAVWLAGALVLLLAMLGGGIMMLGGSGDDGASTVSEARSRAGSPSPSPHRSASPSPSATGSAERRASSSATASGQRTPAAPPAPGPAMEQAVREYFALMPGNTDAGWQRLAPRMQAQGRDSYEQWWGSVESVQLHRAAAVAGQRQVDITLTYRFDDGSASQEDQRLTLEKSRGRYLIADDEVLSSRTVS